MLLNAEHTTKQVFKSRNQSKAIREGALLAIAFDETTPAIKSPDALQLEYLIRCFPYF
jgi:hypothetical protein